MILDHIRFCLVRTTHPGNVGATARAMKTMGLRGLYLVAPARFPDDRATRRAAGGAGLLDEAVVTADLLEALSGCELVLGTTARERSVAWPTIAADRAAALLLKEAQCGRQTAVLFGTERSGLSNEEVEHCHKLIRIPTVDDYSSLNLAAAAQIIAYEICRQAASFRPAGAAEVRRGGRAGADPREMHLFYRHLRETLYDVDFVKTPKPPVVLMRKLVRLFNRARPDHEELNILRGVLTAVQESLKRRRPDRT